MSLYSRHLNFIIYAVFKFLRAFLLILFFKKRKIASCSHFFGAISSLKYLKVRITFLNFSCTPHITFVSYKFLFVFGLFFMLEKVFMSVPPVLLFKSKSLKICLETVFMGTLANWYVLHRGPCSRNLADYFLVGPQVSKAVQFV